MFRAVVIHDPIAAPEHPGRQHFPAEDVVQQKRRYVALAQCRIVWRPALAPLRDGVGTPTRPDRRLDVGKRVHRANLPTAKARQRGPLGHPSGVIPELWPRQRCGGPWPQALASESRGTKASTARRMAAFHGRRRCADVRGGGRLIIGRGRLEDQLGRLSRSVSGVERVRYEGRR
jgi:hypothetical protein